MKQIYHVAKLTNAGVARVPEGKPGMTFPIKSVTVTLGGELIAHVMDFRYPRVMNENIHTDCHVWTLGVGDWEFVSTPTG